MSHFKDVPKSDIDKAEAVFFDIFDTITTRSVDPEYVKKIWAHYLTKVFNIVLNSEEIYKKRNQIEFELCNHSKDLGFDADFKYIDMIMVMYDYLCSDSGLIIEREDFINKCIDIEIDIESSVQVVDEETLSIIKYAKQKNKKIICISDMYLTKDMIRKIFDRLGIGHLIDDIFVSEEGLVSKRSGRLFEKVMHEKKLKPAQCIMIGDNVFSDYEIPSSMDIKSFLINRDLQKQKYQSFSDNNEPGVIIDNLNKVILTESNLPFVDMAYALYNFTEKLYFRLINLGASDVIFFSREGEFLKKIFDAYQETALLKKINTHYVLVSRKSTYMPSLNKLNKEKFETLFKSYNTISVREFMKSLNFTDVDTKKVAESLKNTVGIDKKISNFSKSKDFKNLKADSVFRSIYEKNRTEQRRLLRKYINSLDCPRKGNLHIVDVGWKGSIQSNLQKVIGKRKIEGHYLGMSVNDKAGLENKEGLLFFNYPGESKAFNLFNENRPIFEIILGASHGAAERYVEDRGSINVKTSNIIEERKLFEQTIEPLQKELFAKFCSIKNTLQNKLFDASIVEKKFNRQHYNMIFKPSQKEIDFFRNLKHYENFGLFAFTKFDENIKLGPRGIIEAYYNFLFNFDRYTKDYYWCQLKNYNNNLKLLMKIYALNRLIYFKKNGII